MKANNSYTVSRLRVWILGLVFAVSSFNVIPSAVAHEGMEHITGTIAKVGDNALTVRTTKGATVQVRVDPKTEYTRGKEAEKMANLKEGDRVVIHAMQMNGSLVAHVVSIGINTQHAKGKVKTPKKAISKT
jgi:Cu/Ag efflux protein CusF